VAEQGHLTQSPGRWFTAAVHRASRPNAVDPEQLRDAEPAPLLELSENHKREAKRGLDRRAPVELVRDSEQIDGPQREQRARQCDQEVVVATRPLR
jgi:hypothetical protein